MTKNGSPAPDGTIVEMSSAGPGSLFGFTQGTLTKADIVVEKDGSVVTEDGGATLFFIAADDPALSNDEPAGTYVIQAQVGSAVKQVSVNYLPVTAGESLVLTSINPDRGPYTGGQVVTIFGVNIEAPAEVYFLLNGRPYQGTVINVEEGFDGWITVVTPAFTGEDSSIQQATDVRVKIAPGSSKEQIGRLEDGYILLPAAQTTAPIIFGVSPTSGRSSGGEVVNILGQALGTTTTNTTVEFVDEDGFRRTATVISAAADGSQLQVETPRFSTLPLDVDRPQSVAVSTTNGTGTLEQAFLVLADNPQPEITSISPTAGPLDGGTLLTIFGHGFQIPMQVFVGGLEAIDVNIFNDNTPADQDRITCVTPDYSQQGDVPPVGVDVRVVNSNSGASATSPIQFSYGDPFFISGNSPARGGPGDLVIIYGSGFEDPLQVFLELVGGGGGGTDTISQVEVVSVSGTEIVVRVPDYWVSVCGVTDWQFKVVLLEGDELEASGGAFKIVGNQPWVLSVDPIIIPETSLGLPGTDLTITGQFFANDLLVSIGSYIAQSGDVTVESDTRILVEDLPDVDELGIFFDGIPCTTGGGAPGLRQTSTPVDVSVTNFPGECIDTLAGAIVIEPVSTVCEPTPATLATNPVANWNFPDTAAAACSTNQVLTIANTGGEDATVVNPVLQMGTDFQYVSDNCPAALGYGQDCQYTVQFCPATAGAKADTLAISYNSASTGAQVTSVSLNGNGS